MDRHHHNAPQQQPPQPAAVAVHHVSHQTTQHTPKYTDNKPTIRFYTKAKRDYSLTIRDGKVVLAPTNPSDHHQHWIKDETFSTRVKDEWGFPSFALVNKATGQAIKHSTGYGQTVQLVEYNPDKLDESVLWTQGKDLGDGFHAVRMVNKTHLNLDAWNGDKDHGGVRDGTTVALRYWTTEDIQRWTTGPFYYKMDCHHHLAPSHHNALSQHNAPHSAPVAVHQVSHAVHHVSHRTTHDAAKYTDNKPTIRFYTKAKTDYSLTIRDRKVVLAPNNPSDDHQHWIKDETFSTKVKDKWGFPSFALVNKATRQAIKHSTGYGQPVQLVEYNRDKLDVSVLWTQGEDLGDGFHAVRMVNKVQLNLDAWNGDKDHGGVRDGTTVVLRDWTKKNNQRWTTHPFSKFPDHARLCL